MLELQEPLPVKVIAAVLYGTEEAWEIGIRCMEQRWGAADSLSHIFAFDITDYYALEMGASLSRRFVSFSDLVSPEELASLKHDANGIEAETATSDGHRRLNVDVGCLDVNKLVLASTKEGACKIYLHSGIWADMTLRYSKGGFTSFAWTFADFASERYHPYLLRVREIYKSQLRGRRVESAH